MLSTGGEKNETFFNTPEHSVLNRGSALGRSYLTRVGTAGFYQSLTDLGEGKHPIQPSLAFQL